VRQRISLCVFLACVTLGTFSTAQVKQAPPRLPPDERFKSDILVVVAHPDDQTLAVPYLAKAIYDEHRRVAVIFGNRGNAASNAAGSEAASALSQIMDIEGRQAVAALGISNVWYLNGLDTPGQDVLWSLETWHHGAALEQVVRLMRLTRPEVVLTFLPMYVAGENHGDHQAAGTIATEAFDLAGDPTAFPEQVAPPRDRSKNTNLTEGLEAWQPKKLYYFSDAYHNDFQEGKGPQYSEAEISPSQHVPYAHFLAEGLSFYRTQFPDFRRGAKNHAALDKADFQALPEPWRTWCPCTRFIFGKSVVKSSLNGDVFEGITPGAASYAPHRGYRPSDRHGLSVDLGGPFAFYRDFWPAHNLEHLANLLAPEVALPGDLLHVPLLIRNDSSEAAEAEIRVEVPPGWSERSGTATYPVAAHDTYPTEVVLAAPSQRASDWVQVRCEGVVAGKSIGSVTLRVTRADGGLPQ